MCSQHVKESKTTENEWETQDHETIEIEPTIQDTSQDIDKEFIEVNTKK